MRRALTWTSLGNLKVYANKTPGDGSCLLHAIFNAISSPYRSGWLDGERISRTDLVRRFRSGLADRAGELKDILVHDVEFTPKKLEQLLRSDEALGEQLILVMERLLKTNIIILHEETRDVYYRDKINEEWACVVILFSEEENHYEMVSFDADGVAQTLLKQTHVLVRHLRDRLESLRGH